MIESDIMRNITDQMSEGHPAGCTCDRCTQCRESNCAESTDECAETEQQPGATRRTKGRSPRVLVNCAMLLVVIGLSGLVGRAAETRSATNEIGNVGYVLGPFVHVAVDRDPAQPQAESCDVCGSPTLVWRNCKLICTNCRSILKSCADL